MGRHLNIAFFDHILCKIGKIDFSINLHTNAPLRAISKNEIKFGGHSLFLRYGGCVKNFGTPSYLPKFLIRDVKIKFLVKDLQDPHFCKFLRF